MHFLYGIRNRKDKAHRITLTGLLLEERVARQERVAQEDRQLFLEGLCAEHPLKRVARVQRELL